MAATRERVNLWIEAAKATKSKYIISVCDTFNYEDYPVFCKDKVDLIEKHKRYDDNNVQYVDEIIRINDDDSVDENLILEDNILHDN